MKSYADLAAIWRRVDEEVASTPMPEEYACWVAHILCNDCNQVRRCSSTLLAWRIVRAMMHNIDSLNTLQASAAPYHLCFAVSAASSWSFAMW